MPDTTAPRVAIIMGSRSDWPEVMSHAARTLDDLRIANEARVMSAHRTPDAVLEYASSAAGRGIEVIIAGAGGAAHLAGVIASKTQLPVLGVPISSALLGLDSLLSISQMPGGIPVATFSIGRAGAINAALFAAAILALKDEAISDALRRFRETQTANILAHPDPSEM
ncbi:MAG TPA: 5-(carboxyamino)imidazole ribonucleotide mutase [Dehalococcoidia bacterium]|nr:5-(carboxyamino)imidazole ribonucleotide mutase [Dehalococcoidia bacterium]